MAEFDVRCVNCMHRSHEDKPCPYCPLPTKDNPNARCMEFVRADLFIARSMARMEGYLQQSAGQTMMALSTIFDLLSEAYPEAAIALQTKLEERQKASELAMQEQQAANLREADAALQAAQAQGKEEAMETLAYEYTDNVLPFVPGAASPAELMGCDPEDPTPEVV